MRRALLLAVFLLFPACKQGEHERCQIDDDCEGSLMCSSSQHICVQFGETSPDAPTLIDAHLFDAAGDAIEDAATTDATDAAPDAP